MAELKCLETIVANLTCCLWWNRKHTEFAKYLLTFLLLCGIFCSPVRRLQIKIVEVYYITCWFCISLQRRGRWWLEDGAGECTKRCFRILSVHQVSLLFWAYYVSRVGVRGLSSAYAAVIAIRLRRRKFCRPSPRWNDCIKMDIKPHETLQSGKTVVLTGPL